MKKPTIPALIPSLVAGSLVCAGSVLPAAHAGDTKEQTETTIETAGATTADALNDAWLDGKLESSLLFNGHLNSFNIDTKVENGVAYLSGAVESDIDRDLAGEIAESIDGIVDVKNELVIDKAKASKTDDGDAKNRKGFKTAVGNATLTARIKSELLVNTNTAGLAINVDSSDGQVTLSGEVDSEQERELAGKIAGNAEGSTSVNNELTVKSDS